MLIFIEQFLTGRSCSVCLGSTISTYRHLNNGVPQGSVLSPALFNIGFSTICQIIPPPLKAVIFADDLTVFLSCRQSQKGEQKLQQVVNKLAEWTTSRGLQFSASKSTTMHFCRSRLCTRNLSITLHGSILPTKLPAIKN